jgi:cysteinyl-tRNA synthetase
MALSIYNYLTRAIEPFKPLQEKRVHMYVCGPTVYDHSHLGHAKTYVSFDMMVRYFMHLGYQVRYVRNLTDVGHLLDTGEDRIAKGVRREQVLPMELVDTYIKSYHDDMDALGVLRPSISPRATCHIPEIITWVKGLLDKGYAYEAEGNVYFSIEKFPDYGKLAHRKLEDLEAGARVEVREDKRHPADFALWKRAEPEHIMRWPSPWGEGYPGWHIECSVMAAKYLGETFDIHGGGLENIFPHNECEIAQAEAHNEAPYANYWVLVGSLTVEGVKMSKSLGNFITIKDALKRYTPEALRYFIFSSHYRGPVDISEEALQAAQRGVNRFHNTVRQLRHKLEILAPDTRASAIDGEAQAIQSVDAYRAAFYEAMDDDFNTPQALAVLFDFVKEVNRYLDQSTALETNTLTAMDQLFRDVGGNVLGILPEAMESQADHELVDGLLDILIAMREEYRLNQDWSHADRLRDALKALGIELQDGPEGTTWRLEPKAS